MGSVDLTAVASGARERGSGATVKRSAHIDIMKAAGIVLVVVGHAPGLGPVAKSLIYAFHMPLFFFISGLLLSERKLSASFPQTLSSLWRGLGIPYLFFFALSYLYWLPTHGLTARATHYQDVGWWEPVLGVLVGNGDALFVNVTLWFFTCLFMTSAIFFLARKRFSPARLFVAFNVGAFAFMSIHDRSWTRLPWGLDNAIVALAFYSAGHGFRGWQASARKRMPKRVALVLALASAAGLVYGAGINGEVDLNTLVFGSHPQLYLVNAYLGILALFCLSSILPAHPAATWLAKNTIIIFPTHLLLFGVFTGVGVVAFGLPHAFKAASPLWTAVFPLLALALSVPGAALLRRSVPAVFGGRRPDAGPSTGPVRAWCLSETGEAGGAGDGDRGQDDISGGVARACDQSR